DLAGGTLARYGWPDLAIVPEHASGPEALLLFAQAAKSVGMHTRHDKVEAHHRLEEGSIAQMLEKLYLRGLTFPVVYIFGTDQGGDQQGASRLIRDLLSDSPNILVLWTWCLAHQCHLVVKRSLKRLGASYFSSLAKLTNCWRSAGNPARLARSWKLLYPDRAKEVTSRLPQRPLTGRWGSVFENERHWLRCGKDGLKATYQDALVLHHHRVVATAKRRAGKGKGPKGKGTARGGRASESASGSKGSAAQEPGNPDETESYREQLGRWLKEAMADIEDPSFWMRVHISHYTKEPIMRMCHWLQQEAKAERDRVAARLPPPARSPLQTLVVQKSGEIACMYDGLLDSSAIRDAIVGYSSASNRSHWRSEAVLLIIEGAADFRMRVGHEVETLPMSMAWLCDAHPGDRCAKRARVAEELLRLGVDADRSTFQAKFVNIFRSHLQQVHVTQGQIDPALFLFTLRVFQRVPLDTQEIEGMNSIVRHCQQIAPHIALELLNSRVVNKKVISLVTSTTGQKAFLQELVDSYDDA
ncbi:unnamed protein product, partial [Prorocentrum cordatum]